jgi:hypothetical protein
MGIRLLALVATLGAPQAFASGGEIEMLGITSQAQQESAGVMESILDYLALFL